jgi:hypothetical protein
MRRLHAGAAWTLLAGAALAAPQSSDPGQAEGRELIARIRREMHSIDEVLLGARDSATASRLLERNIRNLDELLHSVENQQSQVIEHLDALLKLVKYQRSKGGS